MNGNHRLQRPPSEQLHDLHVYVIPPELWRQNLRSAANEVITDSISLGFLRVSPHLLLYDLRSEISVQLGDEYLPKDYVFLKSVGRCLTQVKSRQEKELKAKHFLPPYAYTPELFILDSHAESMRDSPSTIFNPSLSGTAAPKSVNDPGYHGNNNSSSNHYLNNNGLSHRYPGHHEVPPLSIQDTPRLNHQQHAGPYDPQYLGASQIDLRKSNYPTFQQPYSHDISALTNAHRNHVYDSDSGGTTYRKQYNDSSGYKPMSSPHRSPESPQPMNVQNGNHYTDNTRIEQDHGGRFHDNTRPSHIERGDTEILDDPQIASSRTIPRSDDSRTADDSVVQKGAVNQNYDERNPIHASQTDLARYTPEATKVSHISQNDPARYTPGLTKVSHISQNDPARHANAPNSSILNLRSADVEGQDASREMMSATPSSSDAFRNSKYVNPDGTQKQDEEQEAVRLSREPNRSEDIRSTPTEKPQYSKNRNELIRQLDEARAQRHLAEKRREELVKKARAVQAKTNNRRNQAREGWKRKYYEAKKLTPTLEAESTKVRAELDAIHKKYLTALEKNKSLADKENHQAEAVRLEYDVDELQRKADAAKMKLTAEMKLRNQAETELRALRAELTQKKMNMNLTRAQRANNIAQSKSPHNPSPGLRESKAMMLAT